MTDAKAVVGQNGESKCRGVDVSEGEYGVQMPEGAGGNGGREIKMSRRKNHEGRDRDEALMTFSGTQPFCVSQCAL
jgi:hypothetical protein